MNFSSAAENLSSPYRFFKTSVCIDKKEKNPLLFMSSDVDKEVNQEKGHKDHCPDELVP